MRQGKGTKFLHTYLSGVPGAFTGDPPRASRPKESSSQMYLRLRPRAHVVLHSRTHAGCDRNQGSRGRVVETHGRKDCLMTRPVIQMESLRERSGETWAARSQAGRTTLVLGFAVS